MNKKRADAPIPKPAGSTWTDDQWRAIVTTGTNVLVAAAAGSGKTAVLVERIIRRIASDTDVDRLLVATFTKAAASEMKERIRVALEKALDAEPGSDHLRRQLALMNRASITTLHSFCLDVIRRYYPLIGLDPGFRIANETEAELLRAEVLDELFEARYAEADGDFIRLADAFGGERGDEPLARLVQELYDFSRSHPWPELWLREAASAFGTADAEALGASDWVRGLRTDIRLSLDGAEAVLLQALELTRQPAGPAPYAETLEDDLMLVRGLQAAVCEDRWERWFEPFRTAAFGKLKAMRGDEYDKSLQERAKALREQAKKSVAGLTEELFRRTPDDYAREMRELAPLMETLAAVVIAFGERYEAAKREKGLLDFGDLEHYCLRILREPGSEPGESKPSTAALEYRRQFDEILLDEYQDTNMVQEAIVELIARPGAGNRFMVGDVKQSIYRFRLAEPNLFLAKYRAFESGAVDGAGGVGADAGFDDGTGAGSGAAAPDAGFPEADAAGGPVPTAIRGLRIDLARNFRSRREVVDGVNDVFRGIMHETVAEMTYDKDAELVLGAPYPDPADKDEARALAVECVLLDRGAAGESAGGDDESMDAAGGSAEDDAESAERLAAAEAAADMQTAQLEARYIARRIRSMMDGGPDGEKPYRVYDSKRGIYRKSAWRDCVILLRATSGWAPILVEELQAHGIPAYAELNTGYFEATEVETMLSLLRVIDNPYQDIPLAGALRSPIVGLSAEELAVVRLAGMRGAYYDAVLRAAESDDVADDLRRKLQSFLDRLAAWRVEARQGSLSDLIWRLCRETGYYDLVGGLPGGVQRQANLRALHDRARQYEATSFRGLFRFLRFIERMQAGGGDLGTARALGEQEDVVRIMSIHKSKGLEFPIVFAAGLGKMFNQQDLNRSFLLHKQLGFGPKLVDGELRVSYPTLPYLAVRRRIRMELLAEEMRVLYVAMTRPKEKMVLLGTVANAGQALERWSGGIDRGAGRMPDHRIAAGRRFLDWIMPMVAAGSIPGSVTYEEALAPPEVAEAEAAGGSGDSTGQAASTLVRGWRFGMLPAAVLGVEAAAAAAEPDEETAALRAGRLATIAAMAPIDEPPSEAGDAIAERLGWQYPYRAATTIAAKTSVTEMKRVLADGAPHAAEAEPLEEAEARLAASESAIGHGAGKSAGAGASAGAGGSADGDAETVIGAAVAPHSPYSFRLRRPRFMEEKSLTPAERGTVSHLVMQHMPLDSALDEPAVKAVVARMVERKLLTSPQAEAVDAASIAAFYASELGTRLRQAQWSKRELPFSCALPAGRVHPLADAADAVREEPVLIQGVVDCLFEDEQGLVLLDYKTDRIAGSDWDRAAERHRFQLELYAEAVGRILGRPVAECHVFFFDGGRSVRLM